MTDTLSKEALFTQVAGYQSAATGTITTTAVDMQGHSQVSFIVALGTITTAGGGTIQLQQGAAANGSDAVDITSSLVNYDADDDSLLVILEQKNLTSRYVRATITRAGANVEVNSVIAIRGGSGYKPVSQSATEVLAASLFT